MISSDDLRRWRELADACFRAPWTASDWSVDCEGTPDYPCDGGCVVCDGEGMRDVIAIESPSEYPDGQVIGTVGLSMFARPHAAFIAAAREAIPALLDEVERLRADREEK